jgi:hypothetical protein
VKVLLYNFLQLPATYPLDPNILNRILIADALNPHSLLKGESLHVLHPYETGTKTINTKRKWTASHINW